MISSLNEYNTIKTPLLHQNSLFHSKYKANEYFCRTEWLRKANEWREGERLWFQVLPHHSRVRARFNVVN